MENEPMTNQHPITPPPELVQKWNEDAVGTHFPPYGYSEFIATPTTDALLVL